MYIIICVKTRHSLIPRSHGKMKNFSTPYIDWVQGNNLLYHMSNSCECMGVNGEAACSLLQVMWEFVSVLQVLWEPYQYYKSRDQSPYQVLQVTCASSGRAMKNRRFIWKLITTVVLSYTRKISLICCRLYCYLCCTLVTIQTATHSWYFQYSFVLWWHISPKVALGRKWSVKVRKSEGVFTLTYQMWTTTSNSP